MRRNSTALAPVAPRRRALRLAAGLALGCAVSLGAAAEELRVMTATAFKPVLAAVVPAFEKRTGHKVRLVDTDDATLAARIRQGEAFHLVVLPPEMLESLADDGAVSGGSITALARAGGGKPTVYAGAVSVAASDMNGPLSLLILLASEDTQAVLKEKGLAAP